MPTNKPEVGQKIRVWWATGRRKVDTDENIATILAILPYTGRYTQWFDCVLRLNTTTRRGWCEMAYNSNEHRLNLRTDD